MKLSKILGRILTDVELRQNSQALGVCELVEHLSGHNPRIYDRFYEARRACCQTDTASYPVEPGNGRDPMGHYYKAEDASAMWRGQYGINRRQLVRDCWHWAKERGL